MIQKDQNFHVFGIKFLILLKIFNNIKNFWYFPGGPVVNQEMAVQSLVWEDSTCHRAIKPMCYNCGILCAPVPRWEKPLQWETWVLLLDRAPAPAPEKAHTQQPRASPAKTKTYHFLKFMIFLVSIWYWPRIYLVLIWYISVVYISGVCIYIYMCVCVCVCIYGIYWPGIYLVLIWYISGNSMLPLNWSVRDPK